jgi:hypothetical protein
MSRRSVLLSLALVALPACQDVTPITAPATGPAVADPRSSLSAGGPSVAGVANSGFTSTQNSSGWAIPEGSKQTCIAAPGSVTLAATCPVLTWDGYTYWAYSYVDNRLAMHIVAYDAMGNIKGRWARSGNRYITGITVDGGARTVSFHGQHSTPITMTWAELQALDLTAPAITLTTPSNNASYTLGQVVNADFGCADEVGGSGLRSCVGTVANGTAINTGTVGSHTFTVHATDNAGNAGSVATAYHVTYPFAGFFAPVTSGAVNVVKAGRGVPVKFSLGGDQGLHVLAAGHPTSRGVACEIGAPTDPIEETVAAGASSLRYDAAAGQYVYVWQTDGAWAGTCRTLTVRLRDNTEHTATFAFTR